MIKLYGGWKGDVVGLLTLIGTYPNEKEALDIISTSFSDMGSMDWFHIEREYTK